MALSTVTVARTLVGDDTAPDHPECTAVFALSGNLLDLLVVNPAISVWKIYDATGALHRAHGKLRKVVRVAGHRGVHVVAGAGALIQSHMNWLIILLVSISGTTFLHICRGIARNVGIVRESAPKLRLVAISFTASSVLALLVRLILSVRLLIIQNLNILIIIIIIWLLTLRLETVHLHARESAVLSLVVAGARSRRTIDIVIRV